MSKIKTRIDVLNILRLLVICLAVSLVVSGCFLTRPVDDIEDPTGPEKRTITEEFDNDLSNWEASKHTAKELPKLTLGNGILKYTNTTSLFLKWALPDASIADYAIEAKVKFLTKPEYSSFGLILRKTGDWEWSGPNWDVNGYWLLFRPTDGKVCMEKRINWTLVGSVVWSPGGGYIALGTWHTLRAEIRGSQITAFIDDVEVFQWTDPEAFSQGETWITLSTGEYEIDSIKWIEL